MFRLAGILQGVLARALQGNASSATALQAGRRARPLGRAGLEAWFNNHSTFEPIKGFPWIFRTVTRFANCRSGSAQFMDRSCLSRRGALPQGAGGESARRQSLAGDQGHRGAEEESPGGRIFGICFCRTPSTAPASPIWSTRRCARSWGARTSRPRRSIARRRIPATWKCWRVTPPRRQQQRWLEPLLDGQDPFGVCDDRTRMSRRAMPPISSPPSCATATAT